MATLYASSKYEFRLNVPIQLAPGIYAVPHQITDSAEREFGDLVGQYYLLLESPLFCVRQTFESRRALEQWVNVVLQQSDNLKALDKLSELYQKSTTQIQTIRETTQTKSQTLIQSLVTQVAQYGRVEVQMTAPLRDRLLSKLKKYTGDTLPNEIAVTPDVIMVRDVTDDGFNHEAWTPYGVIPSPV